MKIIAKFGVELDGHIYHKGEVCKSFDGVITKRIADNFTDENGEPLKVSEGGKTADGKKQEKTAEDLNKADAKAKIAKCIEVMKREGIMQALDGMGITYSPKAKTDYLAKLLLMNKGEITEE